MEIFPIQSSRGFSAAITAKQRRLFLRNKKVPVSEAAKHIHKRLGALSQRLIICGIKYVKRHKRKIRSRLIRLSMVNGERRYPARLILPPFCSLTWRTEFIGLVNVQSGLAH